MKRNLHMSTEIWVCFHFPFPLLSPPPKKKMKGFSAKCSQVFDPVCSKQTKKVIWLGNVNTKPLCVQKSKNSALVLVNNEMPLTVLILFCSLSFPPPSPESSGVDMIYTTEFSCWLLCVTVPSTSSACLWLGSPVYECVMRYEYVTS